MFDLKEKILLSVIIIVNYQLAHSKCYISLSFYYLINGQKGYFGYSCEGKLLLWAHSSPEKLILWIKIGPISKQSKMTDHRFTQMTTHFLVFFMEDGWQSFADMNASMCTHMHDCMLSYIPSYMGMMHPSSSSMYTSRSWHLKQFPYLKNVAFSPV